MNAPSRTESRAHTLLVAFGLVVFAYLVTNVIVTPLAIVEPGAVDPDVQADRGPTILMLLLNFGGFFLAGAIYLAYTDRGWSFVDLRMPTLRDWGWIVATTVGSILFIIVFGIVVTQLGLPQTPSDVINIVGDDQVLLLAMFAIVIFANAPAEEFFFRNIVQKRLYESFSKNGAVVVASLIFALIHVPMYIGGTTTGMVVSLFALFCGSLIFGYAYARTENLLVPTAAHAGYNLFQFGLLYLELEYGELEAFLFPVVELIRLSVIHI